MPQQTVRRYGQRLVALVEDVGLLAILIATLVAAGHEIANLISVGEVGLADLLLLFIYLEVVAMVHAYWQSGHLPVRMPLYIAMVALARHLILDMKDLTEGEILAIGATIVLIGLAVLVVRFGHVRFPYDGSSQK